MDDALTSSSGLKNADGGESGRNAVLATGRRRFRSEHLKRKTEREKGKMGCGG